MSLDLSSLKKAVTSLGNALCVTSAEKLSAMSEEQQKVMIAGVIKNFEFTYELCWKFMKRWLKDNMGKTEVEGVSRRELFRLGAASNLITDIDPWMKYHDARNETSHTYDQDTAREIYEISKTFFKDAEKLLETLEKKND